MMGIHVLVTLIEFALLLLIKHFWGFEMAVLWGIAGACGDIYMLKQEKK